MESKTTAPSFTVSLRGYDRMEVDEYLDSLADALGHVDDAEDRVHGLQAHVDRLNARIADLEERIRSDVPKTGAVLGERIAIMLRSAEEAAADTVNRAEVQATEMLDRAREEVASAEDQARGAILRGEEQARRLEAGARAEAADIVAEAESRAATRTRQIEQWAEQVVSHTRAEEARMLAELQEKRDKGEAELRALLEQRDAVAASIAQLRESLGEALGLVAAGKVAALTDGNGAVGTTAAASAETAAEEAVSASVPVALPAAGTAASPGEDSEPVTGRDDTDDTGDTDDCGDTDDTDDTEEPVARSAETAAVTAVGTEPDTDSVEGGDELPWPAAFRPVDDSADEHDEDEPQMADDDVDPTGEIELRDIPSEASGERDEFDTKFDAWLSTPTGEPRHFRRL